MRTINRKTTTYTKPARPYGGFVLAYRKTVNGLEIRTSKDPLSFDHSQYTVQTFANPLAMRNQIKQLKKHYKWAIPLQKWT